MLKTFCKDKLSLLVATVPKAGNMCDTIFHKHKNPKICLALCPCNLPGFTATDISSHLQACSSHTHWSSKSQVAVDVAGEVIKTLLCTVIRPHPNPKSALGTNVSGLVSSELCTSMKPPDGSSLALATSWEPKASGATTQQRSLAAQLDVSQQGPISSSKGNSNGISMQMRRMKPMNSITKSSAFHQQSSSEL